MNTYWLIEWPQHPEPLTVLHPNAEWLSRRVHQWTVESIRVEQWTNDASEAVHFPSKEDAEAIIKWMWGPEKQIYIATEHMDVDAAPSPATPEAEGVTAKLYAALKQIVDGDTDESVGLPGVKGLFHEAAPTWMQEAHIALEEYEASPPAAHNLAQPTPDEPEVVKMLSKVIEGWKKCAAEWDDEGDSPRASDYIDCADELEEFLKWYRKPDGHFPKVAAAQEQKPVAWGLPNSAITGKQALLSVALEVPSDDQYGGALWVPLFASPTPASGWVQKSAAMEVTKYAWEHADWEWSAVAEGVRSRLDDSDWCLSCELAVAPGETK